MRFVTRNEENVFYNGSSGQWFQWVGNHWNSSTNAEIQQLSHETAKGIFQRKDDNLDMGQWALSSCSNTRLNAMVSLARPYLTVSNSDLNTHSMKLACKNGTLDLTTGQLDPSNRHQYFTQFADVEFDPEATALRFVRFMNEVFAGDEELISYVQSVLGYCLTGGTSEQKFFILYGGGANGKGTLVDAVQSVLGGYSKTAQADTLMQKQFAGGGNASPDIARLVDARAVFLSEGNRSHRLDEALVKQLTGQDIVTARGLYKDPFEFRPKAKFLLSTNILPKIREVGDGIWRRVCPIPFEVSFLGAKMDPGLRVELSKERSGILNWLLEGCLRWQSHGLVEPDKVLAAKNAYRLESDNIQLFLAEKTETISSEKVAKADLYTVYKKWADDQGEHYTATGREFGDVVGQIPGVEPHRTGNSRNWKGLKLINSHGRI
jgi:putative DNA primase/helicase